MIVSCALLIRGRLLVSASQWPTHRRPPSTTQITFCDPISVMSWGRWFNLAPHLVPPTTLIVCDLSAEVSRSLSGLAMWPRLVLDEEATLVVDSRGPLGEHRKSHWQTVLPLLAARPQPVEAGDSIEIRAAVELGGGVAEPPRYSLEGMVRKS